MIDTSGRFGIYLVLITGYDAIGGGIQTYPNYLFVDRQTSGAKPVPYPVSIRMKDKKYERAKEPLYVLFKDYPTVADKVKAYRKTDNFDEIIQLVREIR